MTPRHVALVVGSLAVLAVTVYVLVEVRSAPAQPPAPPRVATPAPPVIAAVDKPAAPARPEVVTPPPSAEDDPIGTEPLPPKLRGVNPPFRAHLDGPPIRLEAAMETANKEYDAGHFEEARALAHKVLMRSPGNERMLRILVSSSCIEGDSVEAQKYFILLPQRDRAAMKTRCDRYGVNFTDPPPQ